MQSDPAMYPKDVSRPPRQPSSLNSWPNQMQQNAYQNTMPGMNPINFSFFPQQVIHDALMMSAPVEAADEPTLVQALLASRSKGENYKDALNGLHGKNGHAASLWKDYYLEHKDRLDSWIVLCIDADIKNKPTTKKPVLAKLTRKRELSYSPDAKSSSAPPAVKQKQKVKKERMSMTPSASQPLTTGRRSTINSLTAPAPVYGDRLPPSNAEVRVPPPPSRSPSPPRRIIPHKGRGNKYTPEDRDFFLKSIAWRLKGDPSLSRNDLCTQLAEKAPHHTAQSWASYWSNHHDIPDKILAAAHSEACGSEEGDQSASEADGDEDEPPIRRRPKYYESSMSSDDEDSPSESEDDGENDSENDNEDDDDNTPVQVYDESEMGPKGSTFTDADLYITAKYVASFSNFASAASKDRWDPYHEQHPQRSAKAWAEYYRRNERVILRLAAKIRKQEGTALTTGTRRASWKRKHHLEMAEDEDDSSKRSRGESRKV
ncbi:hypothetical protein AX17_000361 [Amanita inopinata Kibby_2008]|nr:hypothetical protein AX17_000361 [Amanita inopinata Kibby_2008]